MAMEIVNWSVCLVCSTPDPERLIERMGRICYQSSHKVKVCERCSGSGGEIVGRTIPSISSDEPEVRAQLVESVVCSACGGSGTDVQSARTFVKMILARGHESVVEHPSASFDVVCDRGVSHEVVRHRVASYSQESTRFCNYLKETFGSVIRVIEPPWISNSTDQSLAHEIWKKTVECCERGYFDLLALAHQPPELARSVLQNCLRTEIGMSANFREWRHFLRLRTSAKAHPQMRPVAEAVRAELLRLAPSCFEDIP